MKQRLIGIAALLTLGALMSGVLRFTPNRGGFLMPLLG